MYGRLPFVGAIGAYIMCKNQCIYYPLWHWSQCSLAILADVSPNDSEISCALKVVANRVGLSEWALIWHWHWQWHLHGGALGQLSNCPRNENSADTDTCDAQHWRQHWRHSQRHSVLMCANRHVIRTHREVWLKFIFYSRVLVIQKFISINVHII